MKLYSIIGLAAAPLLLLAGPSGAAARNFDCSKAGNADKTVCKTAAAKPAAQPAARPTPSKPKVVAATPPKARNYDCSKPGNKNKVACKAQATPAATVKPTQVRAPAAAAMGTGPQGATAKCRDNTYSHSKDHKGACSHHGGVANWY